MDIDRSCSEPVHRVVIKTPETEFEIDLNRERDVDLLEHVVRANFWIVKLKTLGYH